MLLYVLYIVRVYVFTTIFVNKYIFSLNHLIHLQLLVSNSLFHTSGFNQISTLYSYVQFIEMKHRRSFQSNPAIKIQYQILAL
jgi:hypothetical protein